MSARWTFTDKGREELTKVLYLELVKAVNRVESFTVEVGLPVKSVPSFVVCPARIGTLLSHCHRLVSNPSSSMFLLKR